MGSGSHEKSGRAIPCSRWSSRPGTVMQPEQLLRT